MLLHLGKGKKGSDVDETDSDENGPSSQNKIDGHVPAVAPVVCEAYSTTAAEDDVNTVAEEKFYNNLLENLGKRFPKQSKDICCVFGKLSMTHFASLSDSDRASYGDKKVNQLLTC